MIAREAGHTAGSPQTGRVESILSCEVLRDVLLVGGVLAEAVEEGEDAGPVPQDLLTAGHQLGVQPGDVSRLSVPASPHQLPHHPLHHGLLLQRLGVAGAAGEQLEAGLVVIRDLGSSSSCPANQVDTQFVQLVLGAATTSTTTALPLSTHWSVVLGWLI